MSSAFRIGSMTVLAACIVWIAASRGQVEARTSAPHQHTAASQLHSNDIGGLQLAARYHLRSRTKRFFQRAGGTRTRAPRVKHYRFLGSDEVSADQIAARYHLRSRTKRFFKRAVC